MNQLPKNQIAKIDFATSGANRANKEVAFIFDNVADYAFLEKSLPDYVDAVVLDSSLDGLEQILSYLLKMPEKHLEAIHVLGHGSQANLNLGAINLNKDNLSEYSLILEKIGNFLSEEGDFLLYGCRVGSGEQGRLFVGDIARIMRADVAASNDVTGAAAKGGNWALETQSGLINIVPLDLAEGYSGILPLPDGLLDVTPSTVPGNFVSGFGLTIDTSGFIAKNVMKQMNLIINYGISRFK